MRVEPDHAWTPEVLAHYEPALWAGEGWRVHASGGSALPFDVARWIATPDAGDESLLARCDGPTLDIGCGPGRFVAALAERGVPALGVDVAAAAVAMTRAGGGLALRRSVFGRLPGAGRWLTALLADGNIGIGGNAGALLARIRELLAPGGAVLVEVEDLAVAVSVVATVVDGDGAVQTTFPWLRIGAAPLLRLATACGFALADAWVCNDRHFLALRRA